MSRRRKRHTGWESAEMNNATYFDYFTRLRSISTNRFKWSGWDDSVDVRYIEHAMFERGSFLGFYDEALGQTCLNYTATGPLSIYDIPRDRMAYATSGYQAFRDDTNSVIFWNNYAHLPDLPTTQLYAKRMADIRRTIDVNIKGQKTPKLLVAPEKQRLALRNLHMQIDGNEPYIFGDSEMHDELRVGVLDTTAPYVADKLETELHMLWNEYLSYLGIENANSDKKERLVAQEVGSNFGLVENARNIALNARQRGCDEFNKMFGTNISVEFNSDIISTVNGVGGVEDGSVYDGS